MKRKNYSKYVLVIITVILLNISSKVYSQNVDKLYEKIDLFSEVLEKIQNEYVEEIDQAEAMDSAINGLLQYLDPYSFYMNQKTFEESQTETSGEFGGLGIEVTMEAGVVKVITPIDDTPASRIGVKAGDYIVRINGEQVQGKTLMEAVNLMRGPVGTSIEITVIRKSLKKISKECDLIITTGGMSVGEEDYVRKVIERNGSLSFWNIAIKPGRPVALGNIFKKPFIGLPGNPVSVMITFLKIALPTINKLSGFLSPKEKNFIVTADFNFKKKSGRTEFLRVKITKNLNGQIKINNYPNSGSGVFTSMVETDGLIELPEKLTYLKKGAKIKFVPYSEMLI